MRANGETERYAVVSGLTLSTDGVIRVMTATGAGWGDPMKRPLELVKQVQVGLFFSVPPCQAV